MISHQPQTPEHDVTVLGSGFGGLFAAALLSRKGLSVSVLREKVLESSCVRDGYSFFPFSNFSERHIKPELLKWLSDVLGLSPSLPAPPKADPPGEKSRPSKDRVPYQVILPSSRIDLFAERGKLLREWEREFPKEVTRLDAFHQKMGDLALRLKDGSPTLNAWPFCVAESRRSLMRWFSLEPSLALSSFSREFQQLIRLQLMSWGSFMTDQFPEPLAAYLLSSDPPSLPFSGSAFEDLRRRIVAVLADRGGRVEEIDEVKEARSHWRRGFTIISGEDSRESRSRFLIINGPLHRMAEVPGSVGEKLSRYRTKIKPRYVSLPLFLGLEEKVIPVGMRNLLVSLADLEGSYEGGNNLFISLSPEGEKREAPEGKRAATVQSLVPMGQLDRTSLMGHQEAVMRHLGRLIPYLDRHTDFVEFNWTLDHASHGPSWGYPHFIYETSSGFRWKEGVLPTRLSGGLYFTGKENFPYLGLEGEVWSGWKVANAILKKLGRS